MTATATGGVRTGAVVRHTIKKDRPALATRSVTRRNAAGHDLGPVELEPTIFGLEPNRAVLHQVVTAQLAASRAGTQSTKTRAEVRGGGAKPFRQKGTGRARQGSSRSPSMSGGGVALGPKPRSYAQRTPKKMVRLALLSALSDRAEIGRIALIDDWKIEAPKTKDAVTVLRKLKLDGHGPGRRGPGRARRRALLRQPARGADHDLRRALGPRRAAGRLAALLGPHPAHGRLGLLGDPPGRGRRAGRSAPTEPTPRAGRPRRRQPTPPTPRRRRRRPSRRHGRRSGPRPGPEPEAQAKAVPEPEAADAATEDGTEEADADA